MSPTNERSVAARPVHQTDLDQTPLPDIFVKIHRYKAPGTIECRRGNEVKEIFLDGGHITRDQYEESVRRLVSTGKRQGTILTEMRVVSPDVMLEAVREQIQEILGSIFAWEGGTISFTPGRDKHHEFVKLDIPIPQALIEGVRHISDAKPLLARLGAKATVMARTSAPMPDAVDGTRVLFELVNLPPLAAGVNARLLYAFATLGLIAEKPDGRINVQVRSSR